MALFNVSKQSVPSSLLRDKYGWPPFSILNTISWDWQRRKDEWEALFTDSTQGRDVKRYNAMPVNTFSARGSQAKKAESVSEFDPYLCELMYRWFSRPGDSVFDPFSGGCVRGIVASALNRNYLGVDISEEQVKTNIDQYHTFLTNFSGVEGCAFWRCEDSEVYTEHISNTKYDMIFTCPPYYNLEKYSNNPDDLSNMPTYEAFLHKYTTILNNSAKLLNEDSFFVIVVSEVRADSYAVANSGYVGLVPDTIYILRNAGLTYYNEIILENSIGSLPIRAPKYFEKTRKIGRHHQNIIVFYKGDIRNIETKFSGISVT